MLRHADVWRAIDLLAERSGLSPSGLARRAGLDPTTFNKSKRITPQGKRRWPSTESLAKALAAAGASPAEFVRMLGEDDTSVLAPRLPLVRASTLSGAAGMASASPAEAPPGALGGGAWTDRPGVGLASGELLFPGIDDPAAFALEIDGPGHLPLYRPGDLLIVSPGAYLHAGHRVALQTRSGDLHLGLLEPRAGGAVAIEGTTPFAPDQVAWVSRIVWASQ